MNTLEEKVGYLIAKMEEQGTDLKAVAYQVNALEKRVDEKFRTAEAIYKVLKFIVLVALAILTLKFGDLPSIWKSLF